MAPEMIKTDQEVTIAADIWSLGCTIVEALSGLPPYGQLNHYQAFFRIVEDEQIQIPEGSDKIRDFLRCCFVKD